MSTTRQEFVAAMLELAEINRPAFDELLTEMRRMARNNRRRRARARAKAVRS